MWPKKYWNAPTQSLHHFQPLNVLWEAIVAKPTPWLTCAIGSDLFSTPMPAHVLLVPWHCRTNPLMISESFCMGGAVINWWTDAILISCACFIICQANLHLEVSSVRYPAIVTIANMKYLRQRKALTSVSANKKENTRISHLCMIQLSSIDGSLCRRLFWSSTEC